eukprot:CAMPEP_0171060020 /NCGR_PEP_ID=MMETSP0766_2-20121228/3563_1 /TAXON_ID=439317 /ORGANISM="Gambierdiscus australes, Strain CAWD 149" /LENGTH=176 /DNA_ID=CAMNT_0011515541 /DNA_START=187 /DNA_END=715 /DNA_ORIENTATION=-
MELTAGHMLQGAVPLATETSQAPGVAPCGGIRFAHHCSNVPVERGETANVLGQSWQGTAAKKALTTLPPQQQASLLQRGTGLLQLLRKQAVAQMDRPPCLEERTSEPAACACETDGFGGQKRQQDMLREARRNERPAPQTVAPHAAKPGHSSCQECQLPRPRNGRPRIPQQLPTST